MRAADPHLEHAATPHRDPCLAADVVDAARRRQTADTSGLDVDDPRRAELDRLARVVAGVDRLVETDRRVDLTLQRRVIDDVVVSERLFDHHRRVCVDALEQRRIRERVRRVRVQHERQVGKLVSDRLRDRGVPARLDLHLHALVTGGELAADRCEQLVDRRLDADRDATQDPVARAAEQLRERAAVALREEVPDRLRHAVLADPGDDALGVLGLMQLGRHQRGDDDLVQQVPNGLGCLARVPGQLRRDAFTPADRALRFHTRDDPRLMRLAGAARFVRALQR